MGNLVTDLWLLFLPVLGVMLVVMIMAIFILRKLNDNSNGRKY